MKGNGRLKVSRILAAVVLTACAASVAMAGSGESELLARMHEIFAKSAAHYKALDAAATSLAESDDDLHEGAETTRLQFPHGFNRGTGKLVMRSIYWWTSGHYPGTLWHLYDATSDVYFKDRALFWTERLAPNQKANTNHDLGFIMMCSFGNARRLMQTKKYDDILRTAAKTLCGRYHDGLGLVRSWGAVNDADGFLVIPDSLMNLELLEWAGKDGFSRAVTIARSHADRMMMNHFRQDGGAYHVLNYDQRTGRVKEIRQGQGASCLTVWSRGQSWAIYGYTMMHRETRDPAYLAFAQRVADYAINNPTMPADGIPYWDYGAPGEERDSSAGACMASALLELSRFVGGEKGKAYRAFAVKQLLSLASPDYFSEGDEIGHFLLKHGVGHKPGGREIDTPLDYGDYYFLEALLRLKGAVDKGKDLRPAEGR